MRACLVAFIFPSVAKILLFEEAVLFATLSMETRQVLVNHRFVITENQTRAHEVLNGINKQYIGVSKSYTIFGFRYLVDDPPVLRPSATSNSFEGSKIPLHNTPPPTHPVDSFSCLRFVSHVLKCITQQFSYRWEAALDPKPRNVVLDPKPRHAALDP